MLVAFFVHPGFPLLTAFWAIVMLFFMLRNVFGLFSDYEASTRQRRR